MKVAARRLLKEQIAVFVVFERGEENDAMWHVPQCNNRHSNFCILRRKDRKPPTRNNRQSNFRIFKRRNRKPPTLYNRHSNFCIPRRKERKPPTRNKRHFIDTNALPCIAQFLKILRDELRTRISEFGWRSSMKG